MDKPPSEGDGSSAPAAAQAKAEGKAVNGTALLVVGMHRSGTSALSGVLNLLGAALPHSLHVADEHNKRGYFEGEAFIDFHERLLARINWPSDDPLPRSDEWLKSPVAGAAAEELAGLLKGEFADHPLVVFKDPRMCRLLPLWREALAKLEHPAVAVLPLRHPLEVAGSLTAKAELPRPHGLMLWLTYVLAGERASRGVRRAFVSYDELLEDWRRTATRLAGELGVAWPRNDAAAAAEVDRFLEKELRHQRSASQPLSAGGLEGLCATAWEQLHVLRSDPDDAAAQAALDSLDAKIRAQAELLAPLVFADHQRFKLRSDAYYDLLKERDLLANTLEETIEARDATLAEKEQLVLDVLADRAQAVEARDSMILQLAAERDRVIGEVAAERNAVIDKTIAERDRVIAEVIAERERVIGEVNAERDRVIRENQAAVEAEHQRLAGIVADLDRGHIAERIKAARRGAEARAVARELEAARARLQEQQGQTEGLLEQLAHTQHHAEALGRALQTEQASRQALLASSSWRATAPLRAVVAKLKRVKLDPPAAPTPLPAADFGAATEPASAPVQTLPSTATQRIVFVSGEAGTPGHRYRVARPAASARLCGAQVTTIAMDEIGGRLDEIRSADILYLWRTPFTGDVPRAVATARDVGAKVVFDVDDLMIDPTLARVEVIDGIRSQHFVADEVAGHFARIRETMLHADLCVGATEELAQRMREAFRPALVLPNTFDHHTVAVSRAAARAWRALKDDGFVRLGYASGSRTHQRDFAQCVEAVADVLRGHPECRLVLFKAPDGPVLFVDEFEPLKGLEAQIEWRDMVPLEQLPREMARFDVNLAPLEAGNPFCEAKSELKFFEAALVDVPTIASPTGPFVRAMRHGETGMLADGAEAWRLALEELVVDAALRRRMAADARRDVLWRFGPERHQKLMGEVLDLLRGGRAAAQAFELRSARTPTGPRAPRIPESHVVHEAGAGSGAAEVTVVIPLYNYAHHIEEALDSVVDQTLETLDLVVVDDRSTDNSLAVALAWAKANASRFNRLLILQNEANSGLAFTRNVGFEAADTPYVLALDADNRLLPECARVCLGTLREEGAAFVYPVIRQFGDAADLLSADPYDPVRLSNGNYIDAMALVSKAAWVAGGGYDHIQGGWEDFDFWCRLAELGLRGARAPGPPLAEYRVHASSMIRSASARAEVIRRMMDELEARHPWLTLVWPLEGSTRHPDPAEPAAAAVKLAAAKGAAAKRAPRRRAPAPQKS